MELRQGSGQVRHVLEHLHTDRAVDTLVRDRKRGRVCLLELDVAEPLAAASSEFEHLWAAVEADDRALRSDLVEQLGTVEARPAADVENPLAARGGQGGTHEAPPAHRIGNPVEGLKSLAGRLVERELGHRASLAEPDQCELRWRSAGGLARYCDGV